MPSPNNRERGQGEAVALAVAGLQQVTDLPGRCRVLGLPVPDADGAIRVRAFGADLRLQTPSFELTDLGTGRPAKTGDRILLLHYLGCPGPVRPAGTWVPFREFPGGQFYTEPFLARSVKPLVARTGNDLAGLRQRLARFDWEPAPLGDLGARVHLMGNLSLALVYYAGDDEFPPRADVLFDGAVRQVFGAEDAAACASRICLGLL